MTDQSKRATSELIKVLEEDMSCDAGPLGNRLEWLELTRRWIDDATIRSSNRDIFAKTSHFATQVCGLPRPSTPTMLDPERLDWFSTAIKEELTELHDAEDLHEQVDAILDLMYFAAGRMHEMGVDGAACFDLIHGANMAKQQGSLAKRPGSRGHDAIKPEGWVPPDLWPVLFREPPKPKLLILGYAQHGKDTVCEMLRDLYGYKFTSSSWFCAEHVMMPYFQGKTWEQDSPEYKSTEGCFTDRHNHRAEWFDQISKYNEPDRSRLAREILQENDIYCGMRRREEFFACREAQLFDHVIWVDRSGHLPSESMFSCTVASSMADVVLDNNGSLGDLELNLAKLLTELGI